MESENQTGSLSGFFWKDQPAQCGIIEVYDYDADVQGFGSMGIWRNLYTSGEDGGDFAGVLKMYFYNNISTVGSMIVYFIMSHFLYARFHM